ncbi:hypothetical protein Tco_0710519 [Tanacetum coccineum]
MNITYDNRYIILRLKKCTSYIKEKNLIEGTISFLTKNTTTICGPHQVCNEWKLQRRKRSEGRHINAAIGIRIQEFVWPNIRNRVALKATIMAVIEMNINFVGKLKRKSSSAKRVVRIDKNINSDVVDVNSDMASDIANMVKASLEKTGIPGIQILLLPARLQYVKTAPDIRLSLLVGANLAARCKRSVLSRQEANCLSFSIVNVSELSKRKTHRRQRQLRQSTA